MENAGLSFSWDSENQQERVPVIRLSREEGRTWKGLELTLVSTT